MKKKYKNNLITVIITILCFSSIIFYIISIRIENLKAADENLTDNKLIFENLFILGTSYDDHNFDSINNPQKIEFSSFIQESNWEYEEFFYFIICTGSSILLDIITIFKNKTKKETSKSITPIEIEGVKLNEEETKVYGLIQEYMNDNKVFFKDNAMFYIKSRYKTNGNLNSNGIEIVIDSLINKRLILESSKLTRNTVLQNKNRRNIYNLIIENPGIYMNKLSRKLNLSPFVTKWHLSILQKFNLIRKHYFNQNISYFKYSLNNKKDHLFNILVRDKCKQILGFLNQNKMGSTKNQIIKALNMHYNTVTKYLDEIDKFNLLIKNKVNNVEYITLNKYKFKELNC